MAKYTLSIHKRVIKFLKSHPDIQPSFREKIQMMTENPFDKRCDITELHGIYRGTWRLRIGKYRFFFFLEKEELIIVFRDARKRGDAYHG